ncbi:MAG: nuclear transport factor 2 family protein [Acidimicrobiia bacterium]
MADLTVEEARALFDRRRAAWLAADLDGYLALFADDLEIAMPGRADPVRGIGPYRQLVTQSFEWARPASFEFHYLAVTGDVVLAEWTISVERRDTGASAAWRGMSVCAIRDGQIAWWREYWGPGTIDR